MESSNNYILLINDGSETGCSILNKLELDGHSIILIDRQPTDKIVQNSNKVIYKSFDFYEIDKIEVEMKGLINNGIKFSGLIYAAGIGGVRPLKLTKTSFLHQMMNANLYAFVEFVRCTIGKQSFFDGGSIVAISSVSSIKGLKSKIAYSASKAALDAAVKGMAAELADRKIRVNTIQKGWVKADMAHEFIQNNMALSQNSDLSKQVLGVMDSDEIANLVKFLIGNESKYITGTNILLDGGYCL